MCTPTLKTCIKYLFYLNLTGTKLSVKEQHAWKILHQSLFKIWIKHIESGHFLLNIFNAPLWSSKCLTYFRTFKLWVPENHHETGRDWSYIQHGEHKLPSTVKTSEAQLGKAQLLLNSCFKAVFLTSTHSQLNTIATAHAHIIHGSCMNLQAADVLAHVKIIEQMPLAAVVFRTNSSKRS